MALDFTLIFFSGSFTKKNTIEKIRLNTSISTTNSPMESSVPISSEPSPEPSTTEASGPEISAPEMTEASTQDNTTFNAVNALLSPHF